MGLSRLIEVIASTSSASLILGVFSLSNIVVLFAINWRLAVLAAGLIAVLLLATVATIPPLRRNLRLTAQVQGKLSALLLTLIGGIARLRIAGAEKRAFARWAEKYREQLDLTNRFQRLSDRLFIVSDLWPTVILIVVFAGVSNLGPTGMSTGDFLAFNMALAQVMTATAGLTRIGFPVLDGLEQYERLRPILDTVPEVNDVRGETVGLAGAIRLSNVSFRYSSDGPLVLDSVNLQVRPGEFVAVVGPSGSGKSTLLRLLLGFETPTEGEVAYDGQDLETLDVQEVRRQIGVVLQDAHLLPGDIYANIVGLSSELTKADAWEAARLAGLADDIEKMPMGMHTMISEGGGGLSSGQRQRLIIARALARRPRILLLDEATSALDNRTQETVSQNIQSRLEGTSRLVIAHRLSTIALADRIYVLSGGKIVQSGRFSQLISEPGVFRDLVRRQTLE
jgi:ATP-binding cassette subfamily C protein